MPRPVMTSPQRSSFSRRLPLTGPGSTALEPALLVPFNQERYSGVHAVLDDPVAFYLPRKVFDPDRLDVANALGHFAHGRLGRIVEAFFRLRHDLDDLYDTAHTASWGSGQAPL